MIHLAAVAILSNLYLFGVFPETCALLILCILAFFTAINAYSLFCLWTNKLGIVKPESALVLREHWTLQVASMIGLYVAFHSGAVLIPGAFAMTVLPSLYYSVLSTLLFFGIIEIVDKEGA